MVWNSQVNSRERTSPFPQFLGGDSSHVGGRDSSLFPRGRKKYLCIQKQPPKPRQAIQCIALLGFPSGVSNHLPLRNRDLAKPPSTKGLGGQYATFTFNCPLPPAGPALAERREAASSVSNYLHPGEDSPALPYAFKTHQADPKQEFSTRRVAKAKHTVSSSRALAGEETKSVHAVAPQKQKSLCRESVRIAVCIEREA